MAKVDDAPGADTIIGILSNSGDGKRTFQRFIWGLIGLALLAVVLVVIGPRLWPPSPAAVAAKIARLPSDASVSDAQLEGHETGTIVFSLPEPKGPGSRLMEIWTINGLMPPVAGPPVMPGLGGIPVRMPSYVAGAGGSAAVSTKNSLYWKQTWSGSTTETYQLTYDPAKRVYRYEKRQAQEGP